MTEYVRLGDVAKLINGRAYSQSELLDSGKYPVLRVGNFFSNSNWYYSDLELNPEKYCDNGDLLYAWSASFGAKIWSGGKVIFHYHIWKIILSEKINREYLYHYLNYQSKRLKDGGHGSSMIHLTKSDMENHIFPLPHLAEQKRIAAALDKMSSVIAKRKRQIALLDEAAKSLFVEMFGDPVENPMGWDVVELKKLSTKIGSGSTPKGGSQSYVESGISLIRSLNVYNNRFKIKDLAHITPEQAKKLDNVTLQKNDVLINITGASVARSCIVPDDVLPARVNQHVSIIRCIPSVLNPIYLNYFLTDGNYQHILLSVGEDGGATREAITKSQLEALGISLPPIDLQNLFAARIEALEAERASCERGLSEMEMAFSAMMQEYFG